MTIRNFIANRTKRHDIRERVTPAEFDSRVTEWLRDIADPADDDSERMEAREIATAWTSMQCVVSAGVTA